MTLNSVMTNGGAMVALRIVSGTDAALDAARKRVATGARVADARDDGAAFAVAQRVRADVAGLAAANLQLGGIQGMLDATLSGLDQVAERMSTLRAVLVRMADEALAPDDFAQNAAQYANLRDQIQNSIDDARYNGRTLLSTSVGAGGGDIHAIRNESAGLLQLAAIDGATLVPAAAPADAATARAALAAGGDFPTVLTALNDAQNGFGTAARAVRQQIDYNAARIDASEAGLAGLVDADMAKESAKVGLLSLRQELGLRNLAVANATPEALLALFRG